MNKNIDYLKSHYENYTYPEPVQDIDKELIENNIVYYDDPTYNWHKIFPEKAFSKNKISHQTLDYECDSTWYTFFAAKLHLESVQLLQGQTATTSECRGLCSSCARQPN